MDDAFAPLIDEYDVTPKTVEDLQQRLRSCFEATCDKYDVSRPSNDMYPPLYETATGAIIQMQQPDESMQDAVDNVRSDLESQESGEGTILFLSGMLMSSQPSAEITNIGNRIYGTIKQAELDGRTFE